MNLIDSTSFQNLVQAGQHFADLHLYYETQPQYPLTEIIPDPLAWRTGGMAVVSVNKLFLYEE